jgi:UDP-glucose 4-epimerase
MRILITGGLGVNGSWVTRKLLAAGHEPVVLENRIDYSLINDVKADLPIIEGDIRDLSFLCEVFRNQNVERVIHMAAIMPDAAQRNLFDGFEINCLGAINIFEAACRYGISRVVFASSKSAYGRIPPGPNAHPAYESVREDHACDPLLPYDVEKLAAEIMARNYHTERGLDVVSLRYGTIYAPGKLSRHASMGMLSAIIENAMRGVTMQITSGGDQVDDIVYVDDIAEGTIAACLAHRPLSPLYNIGSGVGTSLRDFVQAVRTVLPEASIEVGPGLDYMDLGANYYFVSDIEAARHDLGYEPHFSLVDGIRDYIRAVEQLRLLPESIPDSGFS